MHSQQNIKMSSTRCTCPQLACYSINTKAVMGSVSPRSVSHMSRSNINLALVPLDKYCDNMPN